MIDISRQIIATGKVPDAKIDLDKKILNPAQLAEKPRPCPRCAVIMTKVNYAYDSNIIVDQCNACGGMWTDAGEAVKLATFLKGNPILERMGGAMAEHCKEVKEEEASRSHGQMAAYSRYPFLIYLPISLPLRDNAERRTFPGMVAAIIAANLAMYILQLILFGGDQAATFYRQLGLIPAEAFDLAGGSHGFLTSMFVHGGFLHLAGNMLFLWIFADNVEDRFGHVRFLAFYLMAGITADLLEIAISPHSTVPMIGASGAIAGAMGASFVLYPAAKVTTLLYGRLIDIPAVLYLGFWIAMQVLSAKYDPAERSGVAWFAHIGGFAFGALVAVTVKYAAPAWCRHRQRA